jgi:putative phosphoribosyl transferase
MSLHVETPPRLEVRIDTSGVTLDGILELPMGARSVIVFVHGSGSSRHSPRNRFVARHLQSHGMGTLLFDLLTPEEERAERATRHLRFDIGMLAERLSGATDWLLRRPEIRNKPIGYFGASTGAAAALVAAVDDVRVGAIVSRGGRPDLAGIALGLTTAPTLLIVGELDSYVVELNRRAYQHLTSSRSLEIVPGATHLFEERGKLEVVSHLAADWFASHLVPRP